ncbi:hypothetical protein EJ02DRAFT_345695 [Clathrospora elynae]|uniref:Cora-domain-containing protein n=1 Tax=Clathrospora elynae TaxID=706981 RepID=A0A6A5SRS6_9PLEO|nr:hypothetical protein EJ02DRAFT_345695 [Clathrospora elynae]
MGNGGPPDSKEGQLACKNYQITVTEIYASGTSDEHWSVSISVEALLYGKVTLKDILQQVRPKEVNAKVPRAITPHVRKSDLPSVFMPYLSYEANFRQERRTEYVQTVNDEHVLKEAADAGVPREMVPNITERASYNSLREGPRLLQVPEGLDLGAYPYRDSDSDSDFSDDSDSGSPDDLEEEEKALVKSYLHSPPALHIRRTLDQYYYHMLENTKERDIDQVVSRWSLAVKSETRHNILMVDQLWLWTTLQNPLTPSITDSRVGVRTQGGQGHDNQEIPQEDSRERYVISCFPSRTGTGHLSHQTIDDLRLLVLDPNRRKRDPIRKPEDLISRILETCCSVFDRLQDAEMLRFFQMFEDSIGSIDDKENRLFRDFQRGSTRLLELSSANKYYNERKNALLVDLLDIREEIKLLVEIKDIRDEINIILSVLSIQRTLVEQLSQKEPDKPAFLLTTAAENIVRSDIDDFTRLDSHTRTIQDKLNTLMDLKQKAANAWEAREARETTVAASKQGNTVLVFTVVTIIFLPLSFMSSFFAIGVAAFPKNETTGETNWPLGIVTGLLFGISLSVSIPLIVFALNMEYCSVVYRELRHNYLARIGIRLIELLFPLNPRNPSGSYRRRWTDKLQKCYEEYVKDEYKDTTPVAVTVSSTKTSLSFPSTVSSYTIFDADPETLYPPPVGGARRFRMGRKRMDRPFFSSGMSDSVEGSSQERIEKIRQVLDSQ